VSMRPDLVVAWRSGNPDSTLATLEQLGIPLYLSEPLRLEQIAENILDLGVLTGQEAEAARQANHFVAQLHQLQTSYGARTPINVFFQIWHQPLMTVNGQHLISQVIELCGGVNLFADLPALAPHVSIEAVLAVPVEVILISAAGSDGSEAISAWRHWQNLGAVNTTHLYTVPWDLISRHSPRIATGAKLVCEALDRAR